jgi:tetratricopeptide (TPR) repeat protein
MQLVKGQPLFGSGVGTFVDSYQANQSVDLNSLVNHAHNDYVELLVETGFVGFGLLLCFFLTLIRTSWRDWKKRRNRCSRYLYPGALCGLVALLCHGMTDFNFYIPQNGHFFFFLCGLLVAVANVRSSGERERSEFISEDRPRFFMWLTVCLVLFIGGTLFNSGVLLARSSTAAGFADFVNDKAQLVAIDRALRFDPFESRYHYMQGDLLWAVGRTEESLESFADAIRLRPYFAQYLQETAKLVSLQDKDTAEKLFMAGTQVQPGRFSVQLEYAHWLMARGKQDEAMVAFRNGLDKHPKNTSRVLTSLSLARIDTFDMQAALPDRSQCWQYYAQFLALLHDDASAVVAFQRALELANFEERTEPYQAYYKYLRNRKLDMEALPIILTGMKYFPDNAWFHSTAGALYERQEIYYRAIEEYRRALQIDPGLKWVKSVLKRVEDKQ